MKRLLFVIVCVLSFTACQFIDESVEEVQKESFSKNSFTVNSESSVFVIDSSVSSVTISGDLAGKSIYYATVNTNSMPVSDEYVRYISNSGSRSIVSSGKKLVHNHEESEAENERFVCTHKNDFHPEFEPESSRAAAESDKSGSVEKLTLNAGTTKKGIFAVDETSVYKKRDATLWAFNDVCNVWVLDDDKYITKSAEKARIAETYAEKFAIAYPLVRDIFGKESDYVYSSTSGRKQAMEEVSDTGTKVNIVIYDLYGDGSNGDTLGFFTNMDYYKNGLKFRNLTISRSNQGKYFYIDSFYAREYLNYTVSTLVHEFQHMINFSVKSMNGKDSDSNFNEMLSMLCEEMMQDILGISDKYSPKNRIYKFISQYYVAGIREYDSTLQSYANAYAFGAWLTREFGGKALVKEMMSNGKANNECMSAAVNKLNGTNYTFNELFKYFVKACFDQNYYSPIVFENEIVTNLASSYGIFLKSYGTIENYITVNGVPSISLDFNSESGISKEGVLVYIYVK